MASPRVVRVDRHARGFKGHAMARAAARGHVYDHREVVRLEVVVEGDVETDVTGAAARALVEALARAEGLHAPRIAWRGRPVIGQFPCSEARGACYRITWGAEIP